MVSIVYLKGSESPRRWTSAWAYWGIILIILVEVTRSTHRGQRCALPPTGLLDYKQRKENEPQLLFSPCCLLTVHMIWPAALSSGGFDLLWWILKLCIGIHSFFLKLLWSGSLVTATLKLRHTMMSHPPHTRALSVLMLHLGHTNSMCAQQMHPATESSLFNASVYICTDHITLSCICASLFGYYLIICSPSKQWTLSKIPNHRDTCAFSHWITSNKNSWTDFSNRHI